MIRAEDTFGEILPRLPPDARPESAVESVAATGMAAALAVVAVWGLATYVQRTRPGLRLLAPLAVGGAARLAGIAAIAVFSLERVRGPDDAWFLPRAWAVASDGPFSGSSLDDLTHLPIWLTGLQMRLWPMTDLGARIEQIGLALCGLILLATAAYDVAGPRAGHVGAWLLALEPANVFFSAVLHKEPLLLFAEGLVALGCVKIWQRKLDGALVAMVGVGVGAATRDYAALFLVVAVGLVALHATLWPPLRSQQRLVGLGAALLAVFAVGATVASAKADEVVDHLRWLHYDEPRAGELEFRRVRYVEPLDVARDLPRLVFDVLVRPLPWQVTTTSQQLAVVGTVTAWALLIGLAALVLARHDSVMRKAVPFLYPALLSTLAYGLAATNAGTSFRFRTHVLAFAICAIGSLLASHSASGRRATHAQALAAHSAE